MNLEDYNVLVEDYLYQMKETDKPYDIEQKERKRQNEEIKVLREIEFDKPIKDLIDMENIHKLEYRALNEAKSKFYQYKQKKKITDLRKGGLVLLSGSICTKDILNKKFKIIRKNKTTARVKLIEGSLKGEEWNIKYYDLVPYSKEQKEIQKRNYQMNQTMRKIFK